jgi:lysophospholipase L1-like esterase
MSNFPGGLPEAKTDYDNNDLVSSADPNALGKDVNAIGAKVGKDSSAVTATHDYKLSGVADGDKAASVDGEETLTDKTLTSPVITDKTSTGTDNGAETLTNKTLTSPVLNTGISGSALADGDAVDIGTSQTKIVTPDAIKDSRIGEAEFHEVYCFGDSLTFGAGSGDMNMTHKLQDHLGELWNINQAGISGNTTTQMIARLDADVLDYNNAEYVTVWAGINDVHDDDSAADIQTNLQTIYSAISDAGAKVIAIYMTPFKTSSGWTADRQTVVDAVNAWITASATDVDYIIDAYTLLENVADTLDAAYDAGDHIHLDQDGYFAVADEVFSNVTWTPDSTDQLSDGFKKDGWSYSTNNWAYASPTAIFSDADLRTIIQKGDKIKLMQGSTVKYFYVTNVSWSSPNTTVGIIGGSDYTIANSSIRSVYLSKVENPKDWPDWFNFAAVIDGPGGSAGTYAISSTYSAFTMKGKTVRYISTLSISNKGSYSGNLQHHLPVTPNTTSDNRTQHLQMGMVGDTGTLTILGWGYQILSSAKMTFVKSFNSTLVQWSDLGTSDIISVDVTYEI